MANKKNISVEYVNQVKIAAPKGDITLGLPEGDLNVIFLGDLDDSAEKAAWDALSDDAKKEAPHSFWWCQQPFKGFGIAAKPASGGDDDWHTYTVVGPSFVKGCPDLASEDFRSKEASLKTEERTVFKIKHEVKTLPQIDARTGDVKKKHVFTARS